MILSVTKLQLIIYRTDLEDTRWQVIKKILKLQEILNNLQEYAHTGRTKKELPSPQKLVTRAVSLKINLNQFPKLRKSRAISENRPPDNRV